MPSRVGSRPRGQNAPNAVASVKVLQASSRRRSHDWLVSLDPPALRCAPAYAAFFTARTLTETTDSNAARSGLPSGSVSSPTA